MNDWFDWYKDLLDFMGWVLVVVLSGIALAYILIECCYWGAL